MINMLQAEFQYLHPSFFCATKWHENSENPKECWNEQKISCWFLRLLFAFDRVPILQDCSVRELKHCSKNKWRIGFTHSVCGGIMINIFFCLHTTSFFAHRALSQVKSLSFGMLSFHRSIVNQWVDTCRKRSLMFCAGLSFPTSVEKADNQKCIRLWHKSNEATTFLAMVLILSGSLGGTSQLRFLVCLPTDISGGEFTVHSVCERTHLRRHCTKKAKNIPHNVWDCAIVAPLLTSNSHMCKMT